MSSWFARLNLLAVLLCFALVILGAYVRLSNAGLGCPDWPGCYGHPVVPEAAHAIARADQAYPNRPLEAPKAWKEMIHRYLAGIVGLLILALAVLAARRAALPRRLAWTIVGVVLVQIVFGALTVTLKVVPIVVTTHLLLGMTTLALLWWMWLRQGPSVSGIGLPPSAPAWAVLGLCVLAVQIFLGGWTSTNYAAVACPDFPTCQGSFWPTMNFGQAFTLWHKIGPNYEGGVLDATARATIHYTHRLGALTVTLVLGGLGLYLLLRGGRALWRGLGVALLAALALQVAIGIGIVELHFPLWLADAHNGGAALLLLTMVAVNHYLWRARGAPA